MSFLLLLACTASTPEVSANTRTDFVVDPERHERLDQSLASLTAIQTHLDGLAPEQLAEVREAVTMVVTNCPYNRSAVAIPMVMHHVLAQHDDPALAGVKENLDAHVAVLETVGATALVLPAEADYLSADLEGVFTGPQLLQQEDPIASSLALVHQIRELVNRYPVETKARIDAGIAVLDEHTSTEWELKGSLLAMRSHLQAMQVEQTLSPAAQEDSSQLMHLISEFAKLGC